jgi:Flp pilus assembly protein TadD
MKRITAVTAALLFSISASGGAQVGAMMRGTVVDAEGRPVQGVKVEIQFQGSQDLKPKTYTQTTNNKGYFARVGLPDGPYKLVFTKEGYDPSTISTNISLGGLSDLGTVPLRPSGARAAPGGVPSPAAGVPGSAGGASTGTAGAPEAAVLANLQEQVRKTFMQAIEATNAGNLDQAETLYTEIIAKVPSLAVAHSSLGYVYRQKKDWPAAEAAYQKAIELQPDDSSNYVALAVVREAQGQREKAFQTLSEAAPRFENNPKFAYSAGLLYYDWGKADEAAAAFQQTRTLDPANPEPLYFLGLLAVQKNQQQEGLKYLEQYVGASGQNAKNLATAQGLLKALKKS